MIVRGAFPIVLAICLSACAEDANDEENSSEQEQASQSDQPSSAVNKAFLIGVWEGTLGGQSIMTCFNEGGSPVGVYYYTRHLKPIALQEDGENPQGDWVEMTGFDDPTGGRWIVDLAEGGTFSGKWTDGKKSLPIKLTRRESTQSEFASACESPEFLGPRSGGGKVKESGQALDGRKYTRLDFQPGKQFGEDSVSIRSFAIPEEQPGDAAINTALRGMLPDGSPTSDMMDCMGLSMAMGGRDGGFENLTEPELITDRWVGVVSAKSTYCGGTHPNHWQARQVFDRSSGKEIDPSRWIKAGLLSFYTVRDSGPEKAKRPVESIDSKLLALVVKNWPDGNSECIEMLPNFSGYDLGLVREGMVFKPEVPHVATVCAESITIPWTGVGTLSISRR